MRKMCEVKDCKNEATRCVQFEVRKLVGDNHGGFRWVGYTKRWINDNDGGQVVSRDTCDYHCQQIKQMIEEEV